MTPFVVKANNRIKAGPQREAVNEAMNSALNADGSFDFDEIFINHPKEFVVIAGLAYYQITKDNFLVCPPSINIKPAKKYEEMFSQFEKPIICTIKKH